MENAYVLNLSEQKFSDLYLCYCGFAECEPLHSFGPAVRPNYIIHFILKGKGFYRVGDNRYPLKAGDGFLILPDVLTYYQADEKEPWTYLWVGFGGKNASQYLGDVGLGEGRMMFQSDSGEELKQIVLEMLKHRQSSILTDFKLESLLYTFFSVLAKTAVVPKQKYRELENQYIRRAVEFVQNNYPRKIKISDVADYVGITRSYLYTIFMKSFGVSPQEYLSNYRITRASELLTITDLTIEMVAASCGYDDPLVFSKAFKKIKGLPPTKFRKADRNRQDRKIEDEDLSGLV